MKITRVIEDKNKVILIGTENNKESNCFIGDLYYNYFKNKKYIFKVTKKESVNQNEIICTMQEIGKKKDRLSRERKDYIIDFRDFIGKPLYKIGDLEW